MSNLPLNVPYLLKRLCPSARYVMNGRGYGDIVWLDTEVAQPTIEQLEEEFLRIKALDDNIEDRSKNIALKEKQTAHEQLAMAKLKAESDILKAKTEANQEIEAIRAEAKRQIELEKLAVKNEALKMKNLIEQEIAAEKQKIIAELEAATKEDHLSELEKLLASAKDETSAAFLRAKKHLADTDWYVIRSIEEGINVPESISKSRKAARAAIKGIIEAAIETDKGLEDWRALRSKAAPSKDEIINAMKSGGKAAREMIKRVTDVKKAIPKAKKKEDWR